MHTSSLCICFTGIFLSFSGYKSATKVFAVGYQKYYDNKFRRHMPFLPATYWDPLRTLSSTLSSLFLPSLTESFSGVKCACHMLINMLSNKEKRFSV